MHGLHAISKAYYPNGTGRDWNLIGDPSFREGRVAWMKTGTQKQPRGARGRGTQGAGRGQLSEALSRGHPHGRGQASEQLPRGHPRGKLLDAPSPGLALWEQREVFERWDPTTLQASLDAGKRKPQGNSSSSSAPRVPAKSDVSEQPAQRTAQRRSLNAADSPTAIVERWWRTASEADLRTAAIEFRGRGGNPWASPYGNWHQGAPNVQEDDAVESAVTACTASLLALQPPLGEGSQVSSALPPSDIGFTRPQRERSRVSAIQPMREAVSTRH